MHYDSFFRWVQSKHAKGELAEYRTENTEKVREYIRRAARRRHYQYGIGVKGDVILISPKRMRK
jgi:hypothetical protein